MNVLMLSDTYLPDIGGGEVHVFEISKRLAACGHNVRLLVTNPKTDVSDSMNSVHVIRLGSQLKDVPAVSRAVWRELAWCDVVHAHYSYRLAAIAGVLIQLRKRPMAIVIHGLGTLPQADVSWLFGTLMKLYRWISHKAATRVISTSEDLASICYKLVPRERVTIIMNGLDTSAFSLDTWKGHATPRDGDPVILTVRRLVPKNGIHYMISALPYVMEACPKAMLWMVGDGRMRGALEERARQLGVAGHCRFIGRLANEDVPRFAASADVVVFPSTAESTSIACAEMMAMGKAIVASRVGGLIELLGLHEERGRLVKLVDWEASNYDAPNELSEEAYRRLADAVISAIRDHELSMKKIIAAKAFAFSELDWDVIARKTEDVLKKLVC